MVGDQVGQRELDGEIGPDGRLHGGCVSPAKLIETAAGSAAAARRAASPQRGPDSEDRPALFLIGPSLRATPTRRGMVAPMRRSAVTALLALSLSGCKDHTYKPEQDQAPSAQGKQRVMTLPTPPEVEKLAKELELPVSAVGSALTALRGMLPITQALAGTVKRNTPAQVQLGRKLFFDRRLSLGQKVSCHDCHVLAHYGIDSRPLPIGNEGVIGTRNTPTVYNVGGLYSFFWDGRANSLEEQARGPLLNEKELGFETEQQPLEVLRSIPEYVTAFAGAFPEAGQDVLSFEHLLEAFAAYQRHLITPAPWDRYLAGDKQAVPKEALRGFALMVDHGCYGCHGGPLLTGSLERLGARRPWPNQEDQGRSEFSGNESEKMLFRVPSLRNVARTAPYFHDASEDTLPGAVRKMARHQLDQELADRDVASIVTFLESLTGELPAELIQEPQLPASTPETPRPRRRNAASASPPSANQKRADP